MTGDEPIRVLVVDDSPTIRSLVRRLLQRDPHLTVVGEAADGARGVELAAELQPDVVIMDIEMPVLDGLAAIEQIAARRPTPVLVLTAREPTDPVTRAFEATRCGAVEVVAKPANPEGWQQLEHTLSRLVHDLAAARRAPAAGPSSPPARPSPLAGPTGQPIRFIAIAASTGGPEALHRLLAALPQPIPAAVLVVQHIAAGFEEALARWLAGKIGADVAVARDGEQAEPGRVRIAPPGAHLLLAADETIRLDRATPPRGGHRPSADELFHSCARTFPAATVGVVLTGMGSDGAEGLTALQHAGGLTLAQDEASSVVYGMPRAAAARGAVAAALPPAELGLLLARHLKGGRT